MFALLTTPARAELLVANSNFGGGGSPVVLRFNPETGARLGWFGYRSESYEAMTLLSPDEICISSNILGGYELYRFNRRGQYLGVAGSAEMGMFSGMLRGPDGNLYAIMQADGWNYPPGRWRIVRFDGPTPTTLIESGTGGMTKPVDMAIGPDGWLYVADEALGVMRFDAMTGAFVDVLIPNGHGGLPPIARMTFGPDNRLYLSSGTDNSVYRFNGSGEFVVRFIAAGSGGLNGAGDLAFGPDGHICVVSRETRQVLRYDGSTGAFMNVAAADPDLRSPGDIVFIEAAAAYTAGVDDTTPPNVAITAPASGVTGSRQLSFSATGSDNVGVTRVEFSLDGAERFILVDNPPSPYSVNWDTRAFSNGTHTFTVRARDAAGNWGTDSRTFQIQNTDDVTYPTVAITSLTDQAMVSGVVTVTASASDSGGVDLVEFEISGVRFGADAAPPYTAQLDSRTIPDGSYTLVVRATDSSGNINAVTATLDVRNSSPPPPPPPPPSGDASPVVEVWMEEAVPAGANTAASGGDAWNWVASNAVSPPSPSGMRVHQSNTVTGLHEHFFNFAWYPLAVAAGDSVFVYVLIDPANPPREIMLSFCDGSSWEHRAYWGENLITAGQDNTAGRRYMGPLPAAGTWVQLQIPAAQLGLEGRSISGMCFTLFDGRASWDTAGKVR